MLELVVTTLVGGVIMRFVSPLAMRRPANWPTSFAAAGVTAVAMAILLRLLTPLLSGNSSLPLFGAFVLVLSFLVPVLAGKAILRSDADAGPPDWPSAIAIGVVWRVAMLAASFIVSLIF